MTPPRGGDPRQQAREPVAEVYQDVNHVDGVNSQLTHSTSKRTMKAAAANASNKYNNSNNYFTQWTPLIQAS